MDSRADWPYDEQAPEQEAGASTEHMPQQAGTGTEERQSVRTTLTEEQMNG